MSATHDPWMGPHIVGVVCGRAPNYGFKQLEKRPKWTTGVTTVRGQGNMVYTPQSDFLTTIDRRAGRTVDHSMVRRLVFVRHALQLFLRRGWVFY